VEGDLLITGKYSQGPRLNLGSDVAPARASREPPHFKRVRSLRQVTDASVPTVPACGTLIDALETTVASACFTISRCQSLRPCSPGADLTEIRNTARVDSQRIPSSVTVLFKNRLPSISYIDPCAQRNGQSNIYPTRSRQQSTEPIDKVSRENAARHPHVKDGTDSGARARLADEPAGAARPQPPAHAT
jgi:hypothetical protein